MNTQQNGRKSIASQHIAISMTSPSKRRRIFSEPESCDDSRAFLPNTVKSANEKPRGYEIPAVHFSGASRKNPSEEEEGITISATSKQATQTVAPFLAQHIPAQYAPMGGFDQPERSSGMDTNTIYCYRHRPDLKCRRQANEPSMGQLQHVSVYTASYY